MGVAATSVVSGVGESVTCGVAAGGAEVVGPPLGSVQDASSPTATIAEATVRSSFFMMPPWCRVEQIAPVIADVRFSMRYAATDP